MKLLKIARVPPVVVAPEDSIMTAVEKMCDVGVGAVVVVKNGDVVGIFTERDLLTRVVRPGVSTLNTPIAKVMTPNPTVARAEMEASEAFEFMTEKNIRHLPIVDERGKLQGTLSIRHLMRRVVEYLSRELESLNAYVSLDSPGGD
ncbi:MAG: CBS domain-containing protein [candidate division KSB1 bacterium]|nr:CBS domain-containing protein [candidate division KSB1 bacterium]MDZ7368353.1 CBS domain-containing protein [candidate division KSB1 bacterium]MDZ7403073.1 CBS domain-containing protein [candidate division KSB1 bacterium]